MPTCVVLASLVKSTLNATSLFPEPLFAILTFLPILLHAELVLIMVSALVFPERTANLMDLAFLALPMLTVDLGMEARLLVSFLVILQVVFVLIHSNVTTTLNVLEEQETIVKKIDLVWLVLLTLTAETLMEVRHLTNLFAMLPVVFAQDVLTTLTVLELVETIVKLMAAA
jgi:hypothetical protein